MSTFNTDDNFIDHATGKKVMSIMEKYLGTTYSEETCDLIMADIHREFGENADAQVTLDTETTEIEIIVRDVKKRLMKCSSLKLFKDKQKNEDDEWPTGGYGEGKL
jgi:hypothetical protein